MTKHEIALELTKLVYSNVSHAEHTKKFENADYKKAITDTYNYIFKNLDCEEQNK